MLFSLTHLWKIHPGWSSAAKNLLSSLEKVKVSQGTDERFLYRQYLNSHLLLTGEVSISLLILLRADCGNIYSSQYVGETQFQL